MQALERTINTFIPEIIDDLQIGQDKIEQLQSDFTAQFNVEKNKSSMYTIHYSTKIWIDADLSCKARGEHLVSFESVDESNHVTKLLQNQCSTNLGFWTSARDLGNDNWIWRDNGELIMDDVWSTTEPSGNGDCALIHPSNPSYPLDDHPCDRYMCYICESP